MNPETKALFKKAVWQCLPVFHELSQQHFAPHLEWKKSGDSAWQGAYVDRPDLTHVWSVAGKMVEEAAETFNKSFLKNHPEYDGVVGFARFPRINFGSQITFVLRHAIGELWRRHQSFQLDDGAVETLAGELEQFVDSPTARFRFQVQLHNFTTNGDSIPLPDDLRIRRLTENEMTDLHGGPMEAIVSRVPPSSNLPLVEFCIEGETEEKKLVGDMQDEKKTAGDKLKIYAEKTILSLRTFKSGRVGYDMIRYYPLTFCPVPIAYGWYGSVPAGFFYLPIDEYNDFVEHAKLVFTLADPSMTLACSRLAEAEMRERSEDRIIDAVIGLEALLLSNIEGEGRWGEKSFRFSLHYASMFDVPDQRYQALELARDLYTVRSGIAHGTIRPDKPVKVGKEKVLLSAAADRAVETLRFVVRRFLRDANKKPYADSEFWKQRYLGSEVELGESSD